MEPRYCPNCGCDFQEEVPERLREFFGGKQHINSKVWGYYDMSKDRVTHWYCPECKHKWKRD